MEVIIGERAVVNKERRDQIETKEKKNSSSKF